MTLNKEPVAVIQYTEGIDKTYIAYTADNMLSMIRYCEKKGLGCIVNLTSLDTIIPVRSHSPFKTHITPTEYVGEAEPAKATQRSFRELGRVQQARVPPLDNIAHAEMVRKIYRDVQGC